jgi:hypothetical protein
MAEVKVEKPESSGPPKRFNYSRFQTKKGDQETKFDGRYDDIKGFIFDCANGKQADRYTTTIQEITAYAGRPYDYGGDIRWSIKIEKKYVPIKPADVGTTATATDKRIWGKEIDEYVRRKAKLTANYEKLYSLILGQCTEHMVSKLESLDDFKEIERALDVIKLMKAIKGVSYQFEGQKYEDEALHQAMKRFYLFNQHREMTNAKFLETFQTLVSVITECGGEIGHHPRGILRALKEKGGGVSSATPKEFDESKAMAKERYLAVSTLSVCDDSRYNRLNGEIENDYTKGSNHYPKTATEAYNLIVNYRQSKPAGRIYNNSEGVAFVKVDANRQPRERQFRDIEKVNCYNCNKKEHYSDDFPYKQPEREKEKEKEKEKENEKQKHTKEGMTATVMAEETFAYRYDNWEEFNFHQSNHKVNPAWILIDNFSTTDIICNKKLLTNIRPSHTTLKIHCNAGTKEVNQVGTLKNYGTV